jgi:hypothetical protein
MQLPLACAHCNVRLLAINQYAIRRSCHQPTVSRVSVIFPESSSKCSVGAHITRYTMCFTCGPTCWYQNLIQIQHALQSSLSHCILKTVQFPFLLLLHFLMPYLVSNLPLPEGRVGTAWEPAEPQNALLLSLPQCNWATQTYVHRQDTVTCCLLQHCWDWTSEAIMWINLEDQQGNTRDLAFSMISVLVK